MNPSIREDFSWLVSEQAVSILDTVQTAFEENINAISIAKSLRKKHSLERSALIMEQAQLRIRAARKFEKSREMFFTKRGLEQASSLRLAKYKARRFRKLWNVADICCGIGGDLLALSVRASSRSVSTKEINVDDKEHRPLTVGVDCDPLTSMFARKNLEINGIPADIATVDEMTFADVNVEPYDGYHFDPDRRLKGRTVHGNNFAPTLGEIAERIPLSKCVGIKVAPATPRQKCFDDQDVEREWIGDHRECKQQVLWRGPFTRNPGNRTATYVGKRGVSTVSANEQELEQTVEFEDSFQRYLFEPHPAVLAAGLHDVLGKKFGLRRFSSNVVYLTGDDEVKDPLLTQFEILDVVRMDVKSAIKVLKNLDVGEIELKKRGVDRIAFKQFSRMKLEGPNKATVLLTLMGNYRVAVIAKRRGNELPNPKSGETSS